MTRIINFRTFVYTAIIALIGAFLSILFYYNATIAIICFTILATANIALFIIFRKKFKYAFGFAIGAAAVIIIASLSAFTINNLHANIDYSTEHNIKCSVYSVHSEAGECEIIAEKITIDNIACRGKMRIYAEIQPEDKLEFLREGDSIEVNADIYKSNRLTGTDIRYSIYVHSDEITYYAGENSTFQTVRNSLQNTLEHFMGDHYGNLAFGMITGERSGMDIESSTYFGIAGIGHIFAVSGLHIGFIVALISLLTKRLSAKIRVPIIFIFMLLYSIFVGFSPSVMRAMIMSSVCLITMINGQRSDILNNLSLAFTFIITLSPLALFDASFLMSFSSVFGIACFSNPIIRTLKKCKLPRAISSAIAVAASAQIGIMPCLLYFFHSLPLYSVIANIILLPLITICFVLLILICIAFVPFSFVAPLAVPQSLLVILDGAAQFTAALPFAQITIYSNSAVFALLPLYFFISPYVMFPRLKWITSLCAIVCCSVICSVSIINFGHDNAVIPINTFHGVTSLVYKDEKVLLIGDCTDGKQISRTLHSNYLGKIDTVYLTSMSTETAEAILYLRNRNECSTVYCPYGREGEGITKLLESGVDIYIYDKTESPTEISSEYLDDAFIGYSLNLSQSKKLLFLGAQTSYNKLDGTIINSVSAIRCRLFNGYFDDRIFLTNFSVDSIDISDKYIYPIRDIGNYIFDYESGKIYIS